MFSAAVLPSQSFVEPVSRGMFSCLYAQATAWYMAPSSPFVGMRVFRSVSGSVTGGELEYSNGTRLPLQPECVLYLLDTPR